MAVSSNDRDILRTLAGQVAEIAALPAQQETIRLWKALNGLEPERPMVMIDQICWHEMDVDGELALQTEDGFCRQLETDLRRTLYLWKHMPVDMVVEPVMRIPKVITGMEFGITVKEELAVTDVDNVIVSHHFIDQLQTEADLEKLRLPEVALDIEATNRAEETARGIFDGILDVRMTGMSPMARMWDDIVCWHPPDVVLMDLAIRPEFVHQIVKRTMECYLARLDQFEAQGLLEPAQPLVHCTGAYTDELPAAGFDPQAPCAKDAWTAGMAQIFVSVSPEMHQEFELDYAHEWYSRFGLVYYGCCEPLHRKLDIIRRIPNLRKISMSPWTVQEEGAQQIGPDFVFSRKPSPAFLAGEWSPERVEQDLRETIECCERHGCPLELILKDLSTVEYEPQRLWEWAEIATRLAMGSESM